MLRIRDWADFSVGSEANRFINIFWALSLYFVSQNFKLSCLKKDSCFMITESVYFTVSSI